MATDKLVDDVDPSHREPLSVDAAAQLRFPNRPLYDHQTRVFDDREMVGFFSQLTPPQQEAALAYRGDETIGEADPEIMITLTVDMQRKILEHQFCEPVFRMWLSADEWERVKPVPDWTAYTLSDGRIAVWRKRCELDKIMTEDTRLWSTICERIIDDDVL